MNFDEGETVRVLPLGKSGIILEFIGGKHCLVQIDGLKLKCKLSDLRQIEKKREKEPSKKHIARQAFNRPRGNGSKRSLDLHGMTRVEAIRVVEQFLSDCIVDGLEEVEIIHGHGSGALKAALHQYLKTQAVVSRFSLLPTNSGVTKVYFS